MNQDPFRVFRDLYVKFFQGWLWSMCNKYSYKDYEDFMRLIEDPLNQEAERLLAAGYSHEEIDSIMEQAKSEIWTAGSGFSRQKCHEKSDEIKT